MDSVLFLNDRWAFYLWRDHLVHLFAECVDGGVKEVNPTLQTYTNTRRAAVCVCVCMQSVPVSKCDILGLYEADG